MTGTVLIVDDNRDFADSVQSQLEGLGYTVTLAHDETALAAALAGPAPHVMLLDVRLDGPGWKGPDGVDWVPRVLAAWPTTRVIVVSGYLRDDVARRAFDAGAVDVLDKSTAALKEMLRHKVRRATDDAERDFSARPEVRERALREAWKSAQTETHPQRKGEALERTVKGLFGSVAGLTASQSVKNPSQEIDVYVANGSTQPFLLQQGPVWVVECKNWASSATVSTLQPLLHKMSTRHGRCRLGFLISMNGFTSAVHDELLRASSTEQLVVLLNAQDLTEWIDDADRGAWLEQKIVHATSR
ncbi:MAG: response regulator [Myxococcota bacterium]